MNRIFKTAILSAALAATTLATLPAASAHEWHHGHRNRSGNAIAAGVFGLAAGALIAGALSQPDRGYYDDEDYVERRAVRPRPSPVRHYYSDGDVAYNGAAEPWTPQWYRYCSGRYQTFDARTGTFTGYDRLQHFCVAD